VFFFSGSNVGILYVHLFIKWTCKYNYKQIYIYINTGKIYEICFSPLGAI